MSNEKLKVGDSIKYNEDSPKRGKDLYKDMDFKEVDAAAEVKKLKEEENESKMGAFYDTAALSEKFKGKGIDQIEREFSRLHLKVLIVDDDELVREAHLEFIKKKLKFLNTNTACDGEEALEMIASDNYDLVLSDYRMPNMDGCKLFHALKEVRNAPDFVMVSGYTDDSEMRNLRAAGISLIPKPFTIRSIEVILIACLLKKITKINKKILGE